MRSKPSNQKNNAINPLFLKVLIISFVCAAIFVAVLLWPQRETQKPQPDTPGSQTSLKTVQPSVKCSATDQTFCATQVKAANLVNRGYFAGALELQHAVHVQCGDSEVQTTYCNTAPKGTVLNAYKLTVNGATEYLSRNDYIAYFATFQKNYGPFIFINDSTGNGTITMHFKSSGSDTMYSMGFARQSGDWILQSVSVD